MTVFWAENNSKTQFVGGRCKYSNQNEIPVDKGTGLWEDSSCFSINPGTFIVVFSNYIGLSKKNLVFDPNSNGQIWNHPVLSYEMNFHEILTNRTGDLTSSKLSLETLAKAHTPFLELILKKASPGTKFVVGATISVIYLSENLPSKSKVYPDVKQSMKYDFTLELDEDDNILGGEWTSNKHPIFIWTISSDSREENSDSDFPPEGLLNLRKKAIQSSTKNTVLREIVTYLASNSSE
jgi:hypothetical protein